jgi:hypothetical protein
LRDVGDEVRVEFGHVERHESAFGVAHEVDLRGSGESEDVFNEGGDFGG